MMYPRITIFALMALAAPLAGAQAIISPFRDATALVSDGAGATQSQYHWGYGVAPGAQQIGYIANAAGNVTMTSWFKFSGSSIDDQLIAAHGAGYEITGIGFSFLQTLGSTFNASLRFTPGSANVSVLDNAGWDEFANWQPGSSGTEAPATALTWDRISSFGGATSLLGTSSVAAGDIAVGATYKRVNWTYGTNSLFESLVKNRRDFTIRIDPIVPATGNVNFSVRGSALRNTVDPSTPIQLFDGNTNLTVTAQSAPVPEPASLCALALGVAALLRRRSR